MRAWVLCTLLLVLGCGGGSSPTEPSGSGITVQLGTEISYAFADVVIYEAVLLYDGVEKARFKSAAPVRKATFDIVTINDATEGQHTITVRIIRHRVVRGSTNLYAATSVINIRTRSGPRPSQAYGFGPRSLATGGELSVSFSV